VVPTRLRTRVPAEVPSCTPSAGPARACRTDMKIIVIGHGMVGHKFLEQLHALGVPGAEVTVLCEEPRPAYDRVHLSDFFSGRSAEDLSLVEPGFFEKTGFTLRLGAKAVAVERRNNTVT